MSQDKERRPLSVGPDGLRQTKEQSERLDALAAATFGRGAGKDMLKYLRSITIEMVAGPEITDAQLRHREGARYLVGIIEARMRAHQERKKQDARQSD